MSKSESTSKAGSIFGENRAEGGREDDDGVGGAKTLDWATFARFGVLLVLVPAGGDEDDDDPDGFTTSSFLPPPVTKSKRLLVISFSLRFLRTGFGGCGCGGAAGVATSPHQLVLFMASLETGVVAFLEAV